MARCGGREVGRVCAHAAQRHSSNGRREGHVRGVDFVRTPSSDGELDRGSASMSPRVLHTSISIPSRHIACLPLSFSRHL
jgi:hypothetical protein